MLSKILVMFVPFFTHWLPLTCESKGNPPKHPIALALYDASKNAELPAYHMKRIIDARVSIIPALTTLLDIYTFRIQNLTFRPISQWNP